MNHEEEIETKEILDILVKAGYKKHLDKLLSHDRNWTTKKGRLNVSGASRLLKIKPKEWRDLLEKWKILLAGQEENAFDVI